jgi:hypothetical protein
MPNLDFQVDFDIDKAIAPVFGQPMVFHCHHYNTFLQQTVEDPSYIDAKAILTDAAAEVAYEQMTAYYLAHPELTAPADRLAIAAQMFQTCGFGTLELDKLGPDGGVATAPHSHYAIGWKSKFGDREKPGCYFAAGYVAGALSAAYGKPLETYRGEEVSCAAAGAACCTIHVEVK